MPPLLGGTSQSVLPRASYRSHIGCKPLGFGKGSRNRDSVILAFCGLAVESRHLSQRHGATDD